MPRSHALPCVVTLAVLLILGLVIGCFGTVIGAGGGFLLMPILLVWRPGEAADRLTALSLTMIFFNALSGSIGYARLGRIDYRAGLIFAGAALPGAILGAVVVDRIPRASFDGVFAAALAAMAVFLLYRGDRKAGPAGGQASGAPAASASVAGAAAGGDRPAVGVGALISVVVGFIASILGIGGGIVHVPALVHLARFPVHVATATSHFVLAFTSAAAVAVFAARGDLSGNYDIAAALSLGAVVGAQIGARIAHRVRGAMIVRLLGLALLLAALRVGWVAWTGHAASGPAAGPSGPKTAP